MATTLVFTPQHTPPCDEHPRNPASPRANLRQSEIEQLRELHAKLDEERARLRQLETALERERAKRGSVSAPRLLARDVRRQINEEPIPIFNRASQNVAAIAILIRNMPEPSTIEGRRIRDEL